MSNDVNDRTNPYAAPGSLDEQDEFNPVKSIWLHPRKTIRQIVDRNPTYHVITLACLAGIGQSLDRASLRDAGDSMPVMAVIGICIVVGPLGGLLGLWIGALCVRVAGRMIGGTADPEQMRAAIAWAYVPTVAALVLWAPQLALFGSDMFTSEMPTLENSPNLWIPFIAIGAAEVILGLWGIVLMCNTVAEVQGFHSAWRGLGNLVLAILGVMGIVIAIVMFFVVLVAAVT